ncbi:MAG: hypothetical protein JOZ10_12155 [Acidobacteria bacterium]|nr:hypothetical protein [Acidobacteriota bacterium]MBV9146706.1 hypothetical protein [Acidobacteriota bacterium]
MLVSLAVFFEIVMQHGMQQDDPNADDIGASERARQRAKRVQKTHSKKSKD